MKEQTSIKIAKYTEPNKECSALLTIDLQQDFTLPGAPAEIPGTYTILSTVKKTVHFYRKESLPIIHVVRLYLADGSNADLCRRHILEEGKRLVVPGTIGAELVDELKASPDIRLNSSVLLSGSLQSIGDKEWIMYKPRWGAFYLTPLETHLRSLGVDTIVVLGCNFPNCPRATIYEASERDFKIVLVTDAVSGCYEQGLHELKNIGVSLMTSSDFLRSFRAGPKL